MKNLITTLLFIVICTNAISQDQAVIKQPSYPDVESDLVIQIKDQGEEIQKFKEENIRLEKLINDSVQSQDKIINESTSHFNTWLTFAAILISFLGVLSTIFCAFSAWKIHRSEIQVNKNVKSQKMRLNREVDKMRSMCNDFKLNLKATINEFNDLKTSVAKLKEEEIKNIYNEVKKEDIQIANIFAQYADNKKRNIETDDVLIDEIKKYAIKLNDTKTENQYDDNDWIYKGFNSYINKKNQEAILYWEKVNEKYENYSYVLMLWGNALVNWGKAENRPDLIRLSCDKYRKAVHINPKDERLFNNWANALSEWAGLENSVTLYNECIEKYDIAAKISPSSSYIYYNWATSLYDWAISSLEERERKLELLNESCMKYKFAAQINTMDDQIFNNWGTALSYLAKINNDEKLFLMSCEKYQEAAEINPNNENIFNNWGTVLADLAEFNKDDKILLESSEKYQKAAEINPKDDSIYYNWGAALLTLAQHKNDLISYKDEIESILLKAEAIKEGAGSYNLACLYSLLDQKDIALTWFEKNLKHGSSQTKEHILSDSDLDNIKSYPQFNELLDKYFPEK